jgi:type I restriction enzyme S subunit
VTVHGGYAAYKASSIGWCARLPASWDSVTLRWVCSIYAGGTPAKDIAAFWDGGTVPWLNSGCVNQRLVLEASEWITESALKKSSARWIPKGNLVMALAGQGKTKGMVAQLGIDATCNQSLAAIVPKRRVSARYLFWWLDSNYQNVRNMAGGDLRDGLNLELLARIGCPVPSLEEQAQIARFLDYETARIDALIEKQQQLIALLKEKRQAVISHAVTKGLNPDAPLRDSGVEWLGMVPAHWEVGRIKNLARLISKGTTPSTVGGDMVSEGVRYIKAENVGKSMLVATSPAFYISRATDQVLSRSRLEPGDVLVIIAGATTGLCSVVQDDLLPANTNQAVSFVRPILHEHAFWIAYWLSTPFAQRTIWMNAVQAAQPNLSMEDLGNIPIVVPPVDELNKILAFVEDKAKRIDALFSRATAVVELLQERRTALISAAVTGKIDVRAWTPPDSNVEQDVA